MSGFTKLFASIVTSSIWCEDDKTRLVWITMLALADQNGVVNAAVPGLANAARVSIEDCEAALTKFQSPDQYSRSKTNDGRRIEPIEGGWRLLNHGSYRQKLSNIDRTEYQRIKQKEYRKKRSAKAVRAENESRERRYVLAEANGDQKHADQIAAENLPQNNPG